MTTDSCELDTGIVLTSLIQWTLLTSSKV